MDNSISFKFGSPKHGWLPVYFHYKDVQLEFGTSDALNDPIEELFNLVTQIKDNEAMRIIWWLEPGAYLFDFEKKADDYNLTITENE